MAVLRSLESKIEGLFEGVFGRAFRTHVQPIELARKLVKEMDDHRNVSVSNVYVPNEYTVYLSPDDRKQFEGYEDALVAELQSTSPSTRGARSTRCWTRRRCSSPSTTISRSESSASPRGSSRRPRRRALPRPRLHYPRSHSTSPRRR